MSKRLLVFAAALFLSTTAFAQQAAVSAFVTNPGYVSSANTGNNYTGAWGIGAEYWFTPRVSAAVDVSRQRVWVWTYASDSTGALVLSTDRRSIHPVDALFRYHFPGNERWKPYAGIGVRAVHTYANGSLGSPVSGSWNYDPELNAGVTFLITKKLGLDFDARHVVNEQRYTGVDQIRGSIGFSWRW